MIRYSMIVAAGLLGFMSVAQADEAAIRQSLEQNMPGVLVDHITPTPLDGLYEVRSGTEVVYISADGKYLFAGNLIDLPARKNLTEAVRSEIRAEIINALDPNDMIVFPAKGERKHHITVMTDYTCPYCIRLHEELPDLNAAGVEVRYLLTPRHGEQSQVFQDSSKILCAKDRVKAIDEAMKNQQASSKACADDLVREHMRLAEMMGMTGTPFIITDSGVVIPGYRPAADLVRILEATSR